MYSFAVCGNRYKCWSPPLPNSQTLCNVALCNCDTTTTDCIAIYNGQATCAGTGWEFRNATLGEVTVYQNFQFYGNGVWYTPTEPHYSRFEASVVTFVRGIGYESRYVDHPLI